MRLSPAQQHEKRAAAILGKKWEEPTFESQHSIAARKIVKTREEKEQRIVVQDNYSDLKKAELQEACITREIDFNDSETRAQLIEKLLAT